MEVRWVGHAARMRSKMNAYRVLVGKLEGIRPLRGSKRRWGYNIKMERNRAELYGLDSSR
jgi:hypothetical protein